MTPADPAAEPIPSAAAIAAWSTVAFEPSRALGPVLGSGVLRAQADDFIVEEDLGFAPAGTGQHVLLRVRKRDANTQWVARELAKVCRCRPMDVGFAGLKDRRAVAVQWFTVPKSLQTLEAWTTVRTPEFEVLEAHAHTRKLPRGALAGNGFVIRVRDVTVTEQQLSDRAELIARRGVPNYFGPQRFGREGSNLSRITAGLRALRMPERGFVLSAARSLMFNAVLCERVRDGSWDRLEPGDMANLDARGSVFAVDLVDQTLVERCQRLDIHPTGPMWGRGLPASQRRVLELESRVSGQFGAPAALVEEAGMEQERRSLRLAVRNLEWSREPDAVVLRFRLAKGSFATTVLREIFDVASPDGEPDGDG
ncbi:MAG: tRNA pseudouridine13 synthase [Gammaproteobacteria bacterium]|nr:tRNA pseudouridine13 synthase [Gammaproteobacteria bacterium]